MVFSERTEASRERDKWKIPEKHKDLEGKVVSSFEELKALFPDIEIQEKIIRSGFAVYGESAFYTYKDDANLSRKLAYKCPVCKKIKISAPRIEDYDNLRPLSGSKGIKFYCTMSLSLMLDHLICTEAHEIS